MIDDSTFQVAYEILMQNRNLPFTEGSPRPAKKKALSNLKVIPNGLKVIAEYPNIQLIRDIMDGLAPPYCGCIQSIRPKGEMLHYGSIRKVKLNLVPALIMCWFEPATFPTGH